MPKTPASSPILHPVLELLAPRPGEHILDVGCGDGVLTKKIADLGCRVVGVDSSADFVASARKLGLTVMQKSASDMDFGPSFDAVFSNAALALDEGRRRSDRTGGTRTAA